jgi:AraC-like DNA-binding protein
MLQGSKRTLIGDQTYDYATGEFLVISLEMPITAKVMKASVAEPFLSFGMLLNASEIANLLLETGAAKASSGPGVGLSKASPELVDAVLRLVRLLERPDDIAVMRPLVEREILWRLLNGPQGALVRQIGLADSRLSQIGRTVSWIRRHFNQGMRMEDLAEMAGMSVSSFHRNFRSVTQMSPLQYQKQIRLQEARAKLMQGIGEIAAVGFAVGYESPSQFSREYRRQFGVAPGQDAERMVAGA